jgi:hypothetical protein
MRLTWVELKDGQVVRIFKSGRAAMQVPGIETTCFFYRAIAVIAIRHQLFLRSQGFCELCATSITEKWAHMHELKHRGKGGEISMDNSVMACAKCHQHEHKDRNPRFSKKSLDKA